ncbi:MAG: DUF2971 domain-containing protein, partial [Chlamydiota bacterium]|nr:DUF2971 domain-containing protein [Chlamydiota bacterium]
TQPWAINDPFEFNPAIRFKSKADDYRYYEYDGVTFPSNYLWNWLNLIESRINVYGILSLTDNPFSYEMWSHYANGHRGFLIEFNVGNKKKPRLESQKGVSSPVHRVRYVNVNIVNVDKMTNKNNKIPPSQFRDKIFLRKTKLWRHEREYRVIRPFDSCETYRPPAQRTSYRNNDVYRFPISLDCIVSVTFGVNTSIEDKEKIIRLCDGYKIAFLQALIPKDSKNEVRPRPISDFGSLENYLTMEPQIFTFDSIENNYFHEPTIKVNSLSEIPYYNIQKEDYDLYYKKRKTHLQETADIPGATPHNTSINGGIRT